jgi:hypothetical protein
LGASAGIWSMTSIPSSICTLSRRRLSFGMSRVAELGNAGGGSALSGKNEDRLPPFPFGGTGLACRCSSLPR